MGAICTLGGFSEMPCQFKKANNMAALSASNDRPSRPT